MSWWTYLSQVAWSKVLDQDLIAAIEQCFIFHVMTWWDLNALFCLITNNLDCWWHLKRRFEGYVQIYLYLYSLSSRKDIFLKILSLINPLEDFSSLNLLIILSSFSSRFCFRMVDKENLKLTHHFFSPHE